MHPHRSHWITALAALFAVGLIDAPVFAPGRQPVAERRRRAATGIHRPPRARLVADRDCHRRADVRLRGRRQQEGGRRHHFRAWHGDGRGEFSHVALFMSIGPGRARVGRVPGPVGPPHHAGGRTALVPLVGHDRHGHVERDQLDCPRGGDLFRPATPWAGGHGALTRTCSVSCVNPSDSRPATTRLSGPSSRGTFASPRPAERRDHDDHRSRTWPTTTRPVPWPTSCRIGAGSPMTGRVSPGAASW